MKANRLPVLPAILASLLALLLATTTGCPGQQPALVVETNLLPPDGKLPVLEAPISPEETTALRTGFDWATSVELPETDPDGYPALYYVLVYVADAAQEQVLDLIGVTYSPLPMFPEERERWAGQSGVFTRFGDGEGHFEFVVMPGVVFNAIRERALAGDPLFSAIVARDVPVSEAVHSTGALRYRYLSDQGFTYGMDGPPEQKALVGTNTVTQPFIIELLLLMAASHDVRDGVDDVLSEIDRETRGRVNIGASLRVHHTDRDFGGPNVEYTPAWRSGLFRLANVPMVAQSAMGTVRALTNDDGVATLQVAHGQMYTLCARGQNHAGAVSHSDRPVHLCVFEASGDFMGSDPLNFSAPDDGVVHMLRVSDYHFNLIAQMTDAYTFIEERFGYRMSRGAALLVGPAADAFGSLNENRAFTLCGGYNTFAVHSIATIVGLFDSLIEPFGITSWRIAGHDISFPNAGSDVATHSRLVPIHEYGHFFMCELIAARGYEKITEYLFDVTWTSFTTTQVPGVSNLTVVEGFADWFTSRVAGGTNYISLPGDAPATNGRRSVSSNGYYCDPAAPFCLEDNMGGMSQRTPVGDNNPFNNDVAQVTTLLHDAFDGHVSGGQSVGIGAYYRWDGSQFRFSGTDRDQNDESVALPASALFDIFDTWASRYNTVTVSNIFDSIGAVALDHGFTEAQVCQLFALHEPTNDCTQIVDASAVDTTLAVPSRPLILSAQPLSESVINVRWEDVTPFVSTSVGWEYDGEDGSGEVWQGPYFRTGQQPISGLSPDTRYEIGVAIINNGRAGLQARTQAVTFAQPVTTLTLTPGPGEMHVDWDPVAATSYVVEIEEAGERRDVATVSSTSATVGGLTEGIPYTFRVYSRNQLGVRGAPSAPATGEVLMPDVVFVSASFGDDFAPNAGSASVPFASFDAGMAAALARGATVLRLEHGSYMSGSAYVLSDDFSIEGGFQVSAGAWTPHPDGIRSEILFSTGAPTNRCITDRYAPGVDTVAPLVVTSGAELRLRTLVMYNDLNPGTTACSTAVHLEGAHLVADEISIGRGLAPVAGICTTAIQGRLVSAVRPNVTIRNSVISGIGASGTATNNRIAGLCLDGGGFVRIEDSSVAAAGALYPLIASTTAEVGVTLDDVIDLQIARSLISTRQTSQLASAAAASPSTYLAGLSATSNGVIRIDNSIVTTHAGGVINRAVDIGSLGALTSLFVYQSVLNAGTNFSQSFAPPANINGAALYLAGNLSAADVGLVSSTFTYAAGGQSVAGTSVFTGLDRRAVTGDPLRFRLQGNVFSVPQIFSNVSPYALCGLSEFELVTSTAGLNEVVSHPCEAGTNTSTWLASNNVAVWVPPQEAVGCTPACGAGTYCDGTACVARNTSRALSFEVSGYPRPVDLDFIYNTTGVPLATYPHADEVDRDRQRRQRNVSVREGAGAYLR